MYNISQKLVAEFLGTFALIFFGAGAICTERFLQSTGNRPTGDALASEFGIAILSLAFGHVSGGHFNPAVTIGFWITKRMNTVEVLRYWIAQTRRSRCSLCAESNSSLKTPGNPCLRRSSRAISRAGRPWPSKPPSPFFWCSSISPPFRTIESLPLHPVLPSVWRTPLASWWRVHSREARSIPRAPLDRLWPAPIGLTRAFTGSVHSPAGLPRHCFTIFSI